jgi:hypothetical protein
VTSGTTGISGMHVRVSVRKSSVASKDRVMEAESESIGVDLMGALVMSSI